MITPDIGFAVTPIETCTHFTKEQLEKISQIVENESEEFFEQSSCADCKSKKENWICLDCQQIRCSRFVNEHQLIHNAETKHPVGLSLSDLSLWCYECEAYITNKLIASFQKFLSEIKFANWTSPQTFQDEIQQIINRVQKVEITQGYPYESFIKGLKEKTFKKIVFLTGAGISVAAGIPDFRSPNTGLYSKLAKYNLPNPEAVFEINYFQENPQAFYELSKELFSHKAKPVLAHKFIQLLEKREQLLMCFTQNIDGLELDAGLHKEHLVQAHGHMRTARCIKCKVEVDIKKFLKAIETQEIMKCEKCTDGLIKPDVVFFGEGLPQEFFLNWERITEADLVIVMGTSLKVMPFAMSLKLIKVDIPIVLLNRENVISRENLLFIEGDIEENVAKIMDQLK